MKIAIISDVHSNLPALLAVVEDIGRWGPDRVVVAGDLVNRGPRPVECLELVQRQPNWELVLGNHEEYVLEQARPDAPRSGPRFELQQPSFWTLEQLDGRAAGLAELPPVWELEGPDGRPVRVYHASPLGMRVGIRPETSDDEVRELIAPAPAVFGTGHTHVPLVRRVDETLVVNAGSVGAPCDGDPRASYAQLDLRRPGGWQARIARVAYDRAWMAREISRPDYLAGAGPLEKILELEWRYSRSLLPGWLRRFEAAVLRGELTLAQAVDRYLAEWPAAG